MNEKFQAMIKRVKAQPHSGMYGTEQTDLLNKVGKAVSESLTK